MSNKLGASLSWSRCESVRNGSLWTASPRGTASTGSSPRGRSSATRVYASRDNREIVENALKKGNEMVDGVVEWVPSFVPRTVAKIGVTFIALSIVGSLFQQVLSVVVFFAVVASIGYILFQSSSKEKTQPRDSDDDDDPIERANKIMDKYR